MFPAADKIISRHLEELPQDPSQTSPKSNTALWNGRSVTPANPTRLPFSPTLNNTTQHKQWAHPVSGQHSDDDSSATSVDCTSPMKVDEAVAMEASKITQWAQNIHRQRNKEYTQIETTLKFIPSTSENKQKIALLKKCLPIAKGYSNASKQYATWTEYRVALIREDKTAEQISPKERESISSDWTLDELNDDWEIIKEEPWAQETTDPTYEYVKQLASDFCTQEENPLRATAPSRNSKSAFVKAQPTRPFPAHPSEDFSTSQEDQLTIEEKEALDEKNLAYYYDLEHPDEKGTISWNKLGMGKVIPPPPDGSDGSNGCTIS